MHDDAQFTCYVKKYMDMVFRVAFNYLESKADAEDVAQNAFIKLYRTNKVFESEDHVKHWLIRVAVNECKKTAVSVWRHAVPLESSTIADFEFPSEEHVQIMDAVMRLKPKYRIVICLFYYEGYSTEEISKALGIPKATVLTHLKRGREALKKQLTEDESNV